MNSKPASRQDNGSIIPKEMGSTKVLTTPKGDRLAELKATELKAAIGFEIKERGGIGHLRISAAPLDKVEKPANSGTLSSRAPQFDEKDTQELDRDSVLTLGVAPSVTAMDVHFQQFIRWAAWGITAAWFAGAIYVAAANGPAGLTIQDPRAPLPPFWRRSPCSG